MVLVPFQCSSRSWTSVVIEHVSLLSFQVDPDDMVDGDDMSYGSQPIIQATSLAVELPPVLAAPVSPSTIPPMKPIDKSMSSQESLSISSVASTSSPTSSPPTSTPMTTPSVPFGAAITDLLKGGEWIEADDMSTGRKYYYHSVTKSVSWTNPVWLGLFAGRLV